MGALMELGVYPERCRKSIRRLVAAIGVSTDRAYRMILTTAALMDLMPEDDRVADMILEDSGIYPAFSRDIA